MAKSSASTSSKKGKSLGGPAIFGLTITYIPTDTVIYDAPAREFEVSCTNQYGVPDHPEIVLTIAFERRPSSTRRLDIGMRRLPAGDTGIALSIGWRHRNNGEDGEGAEASRCDETITVGPIRVRTRTE